MQLETGKSTTGLVGAFKTIIKEEGCVVHVVLVKCLLMIIYVDLDVCTEVLYPHYFWRHQSALRSCALHYCLLVKTPLSCSHPSASNDFWGKTYLKMTGDDKMTQQLSILTGCSAGATESFVVVPFELVKIRCVVAFLNASSV